MFIRAIVIPITTSVCCVVVLSAINASCEVAVIRRGAVHSDEVGTCHHAQNAVMAVDHAQMAQAQSAKHAVRALRARVVILSVDADQPANVQTCAEAHSPIV